MLKFILKRILFMIPVLWVIITVSFMITRFAPGSPFSIERGLNETVMANLEKKWHLDEPVYRQYLYYMSGILRGDLGPSMFYHDRSVNEIIAASLPVSLILGFVALLLAVLGGILAGAISAYFQNKWPDYASSSLAIIGMSIPPFVIGPVLVYIFAMKLHWLPTSGWIGDHPLTLILPAFTLSLSYFATITRLMRSSMIDILNSDYIRTAHAKGLSQVTVVLRHAIKGSILPVVSYLGPAFTNIMTGSLVVEQIFRIPGMGRPFVQSALNRDYTLIMGCVLVYSIILIVMNTLVDILYAWLDPRIAYA